MIFICSFITLAVFFTVFALLATSGFIVFSSDGKKSPPSGPSPAPKAAKVVTAVTTVKAKPKAYIDLNGRLIELLSKAEETKAKKDGFKVVYK